MLLVGLFPSCDPLYHPSTICAERYLFDLAHAIARSVPDVEVHARLGTNKGDEVVFPGRSSAETDDDVQLF